MNLSTIKLTRNIYAPARLAMFAVLAIGAARSAEPSSATTLYAETRATQSYTTFVAALPIDGLSLSLPPASTAHNTAIVTLTLPNLYLSLPTSQTSAMSALLEIVAPFAPGGLITADGGIGCDSASVSVSGKKPMTIVLKVPLGPAGQPVYAEWFSLNGTVTTDTFASISAVLVRE